MSESAFAPWIGRQEETHDQLSRNLVKRIAATFGEPTPAHGEALPPLWHWAFFQDPVEAAGLGVDGHPARGGFLPPADDRNRMWAGGRLEFHQPLRVGGARPAAPRPSSGSRRSTVRSGALLFVTLRHDYRQDGQLGAERRARHRLPRTDPAQARRYRGLARGRLARGAGARSGVAVPLLGGDFSTATAFTTTGPMSPMPKAIRAWWCTVR
ncbi:itaconyl-CoA hydratase [Pseudomonas aeruginosa]|nr:itaconyl-CoA hydratase [Pseudomonas aeruginosa]